MKKLIEFFFLEGELSLVGIEVNGNKNYTADIRTWMLDEIVIVTSNRTLPDATFNQQYIDEMIEKGIFTKKEIEVDVEIEKDHYYYITVQKSLLKDIF